MATGMATSNKVELFLEPYSSEADFTFVLQDGNSAKLLGEAITRLLKTPVLVGNEGAAGG